MYKNSGEGVVAGLTYSNWTSRGLGFRTGFQYISKAAYVDNILGIPVAVAYRTKGKDPYARIDNALNSAAESDRYPYDSYSENMRNTFFNFLLGLFSNAEFYAGITPGYIIGNDSSTRSNSWSSGEKTHRQDSWTEVKNRFSTSLDAGMNLNFRIWRFDLKIMPAFHFNVTDNFVIHTSEWNSVKGETLHTTQHTRWFFSISGGLTFNF